MKHSGDIFCRVALRLNVHTLKLKKRIVNWSHFRDFSVDMTKKTVPRIYKYFDIYTVS